MGDRNQRINHTPWEEHSYDDMMKILKSADRLAWSESELLIIRDMIVEVKWHREQISTKHISKTIG